MVKVGAATAQQDAARVHLEGHLVCLDGDGHGAGVQSGLGFWCGWRYRTWHGIKSLSTSTEIHHMNKLVGHIFENNNTTQH